MSKQILFTAVLALGVGAGAGYWYAARTTEAPGATSQGEARKPLFYRHPMNPEITSPVPAKDEMGMDYIPVYAEEPKKERKILFYRHPMNPEITSPVPAKDEMGMDYIPVYADEGDGGDEPAGTVRIDPVTVQNIGVRTARVERRTLSRHITTVGRVDYDEELLTRLHPKVEGWVEKLFINETGTAVKKDTILLSIYSPQLVSSQEEYLLALENWEILRNSPFEDIRRTAKELVVSARKRLELFDVPEHQIRELEETRKVRRNLHIHSPAEGIVMKIGVREGQYVTPRTELYMIADLSKIWVYVDIFEYELPWVRVGDEAEMRLVGLPGKVLRGKITYIYPYAESKTRTVKVRLEFDNPGLLLKPEMYASVTIHAGRREDALVIPAEAIVRTGTREQVFVVRGPGKFEPRPVTPGLASDGYVEILEGLRPGEEVVTSSQFLIDSESKLREAAAKMLEPKKQAGHDGMSADGAMNHAGTESGTSGHDGMERKEMDHGAEGKGSSMNHNGNARGMSHD